MSKGKYKNPAFEIRIDQDILAKIKAIAEKESRSTNKQIEYCLRQWLVSNKKDTID